MYVIHGLKRVDVGVIVRVGTQEEMKTMRSMTITAALLAVIALSAAAFSGCATEEVAEPSQPAETAVQTDVPPEVAAELAKLPEADRRLAAQQRICPVTEELLGSMGVPKKIVVEGREIFICCASCEDELRSKPEEYFSKIDNQ